MFTYAIALLLMGTAQADEATDIHSQLVELRTRRLAPGPPNVKLSEVRQALGGKTVTGIQVVEEIKAAKGYGLKVYDIPPQQLWKAIVDERHHANYLPVQMSRVIMGDPVKTGRTIFQYINIPIVSDRWWTVNLAHNAALYKETDGKVWELYWEDRNNDPETLSRIPATWIEDGVPLAWTKGSWLLIALDGERTFVEYYVWSDPGGSLPVGPATRFSAGAVDDNLAGMQDFAQKHVPTCKHGFTGPDGQPL